jgi:hypothetical protein
LNAGVFAQPRWESAIRSGAVQWRRAPKTAFPSRDLICLEQLLGYLKANVALVTSSGRNIGRATALKLAGKGFKSLSMMRARTRLSIGAGPHVFYEAQRCRPIAVIAGDNDGDEFAVPMLCQGSQEDRNHQP